jgi:hypothetical protein
MVCDHLFENQITKLRIQPHHGILHKSLKERIIIKSPILKKDPLYVQKIDSPQYEGTSSLIWVPVISEEGQI